jgi:hypothetical protein
MPSLIYYSYYLLSLCAVTIVLVKVILVIVSIIYIDICALEDMEESIKLEPYNITNNLG